jgi:hypothetical protein
MGRHRGKVYRPRRGAEEGINPANIMTSRTAGN